MSDELEDLKRRLEEAERKAAIWRSQVVALLVVLVVGGAAALLWTRASVAKEIARIDARVLPPGFVQDRMEAKVVEAEAFVVKDGEGTEVARLGWDDRFGARLLFSQEDLTTYLSIYGLSIMNDLIVDGVKSDTLAVIRVMLGVTPYNDSTTLHLGNGGVGRRGQFVVDVTPDGKVEFSR